MIPDTPLATDAWNAAVRRATAVVDRNRPGGMDETTWDTVAMRDIIAVVLYALHARIGTAVDAVPWSQVLWWLRDDHHVITLVEDAIPGAATAAESGGSLAEAPALARWRWLNRTWDPAAPLRRRDWPAMPWGPRQQDHALGGPLSEPRWEGMSRGIAQGLPDPAIEICTPWAAGVVAAVLGAEQGGHSRHQRVRVVSGEHAGQHGYVSDVGWAFNDEVQQVNGPAGYVVDLDDTPGTERIDAEHLAAATDRRWPRRPEGTLKDGPPPEIGTPLPPAASCADDLEDLLASAGNPDAVPEELRRTIRAASSHQRLDVRRVASPRPRRMTVALLLHRYTSETTEHVTGVPVAGAEIWELVIAEHLHDETPRRLLATSEEAARSLAAEHTALFL